MIKSNVTSMITTLRCDDENSISKNHHESQLQMQDGGADSPCHNLSPTNSSSDCPALVCHMCPTLKFGA